MSTRKQYQSMTGKQREADCAQVIRSFYQQHKRPPVVTEMPAMFGARVRSIWGSWEKAINSVLKVQTRHVWRDEEIIVTLQDLYLGLGRFPKMQDVLAVKKSLKRLIAIRFKSLNTALEHAIHDSPRLQVLKALEELTPPRCDAASTREIAALLEQKKIVLSTQEVGIHLDDARRAGYVSCKRYSATSAWWLTSLGKGFLSKWKTTGSR